MLLQGSWQQPKSGKDSSVLTYMFNCFSIMEQIQQVKPFGFHDKATNILQHYSHFKGTFNAWRKL